MACYHPVPARQEGDGQQVRIRPPIGDANLQLPCGQCLGCRTDRASLWAWRAVHEARYHEHNRFITLTYSDDHLPRDGALQPRDLWKLLKDLRNDLAANVRRVAKGRPGRAPDLLGQRLRYLACGEYGENFGRPHYHALLFGVGFGDEEVAAKDLYASAYLTKRWGKGEVRIGQLTAASAAYTAQYTMKSMGRTYCDADGVVKQGPFLRVSSRPGIGAIWVEEFAPDLQHAYMIVDGAKRRIPRYYKKKLDDVYPVLAEEIKTRSRKYRDKIKIDAQSPERLKDAEAIHRRRNELVRQRTF